VSAPTPVRVGLAQMNPGLGALAKNLQAHAVWVKRAREAGCQVAIFPELSLTGYFLKDLVPEVAVREGSPEWEELCGLSRGIDVCVGLVLESPDARYYNAACYFSEGALRHLHRKVYLPTYGMFDEQRYIAAGDRLRAFAMRAGRAGILICEDMWHPSAAYLLSLQGVNLFICPSASPGRGVAEGPRVGTAASYDLLCRTYAEFFVSYVVYVNRVGYEDGANFWGGSMAVAPSGEVLTRAEGDEEVLLTVDLDPGAVRRERLNNPLLRDERVEMTLDELQRLIDERTRDQF
jgi:predicted amidohydrolase